MLDVRENDWKKLSWNNYKAMSFAVHKNILCVSPQQEFKRFSANFAIFTKILWKLNIWCGGIANIDPLNAAEAAAFRLIFARVRFSTSGNPG